MAYTFQLAGQDITPYVQWLEAGGDSIPNAQAITIDSTLGQGPGISAGNSGRAATATFLVALGPAASAQGAGQPITGGQTASAYLATIAADSPSAFFKLNNSVTDTTGAYTLTKAGNPTLGVAGYYSGGDTALAGDNASGSYSAMLSPGLGVGNNPFTFEVLAKPNGASANSIGVALLVGTWGTAHEAAYLCQTNAGKWSIRSYSGATLDAPSAYTAGQWYHLAATWDGTHWTLYVNGVSANTGTDTGLNITFGSTGIAGVPGQARGFNGTLQYAAFYPSPLSAAQVLAHYNALSTVANPQLVRQGEIIITDLATNAVVFGGYVSKLDDATDGTVVYTQVSCYDYWQHLDRYTINEVFDGVTDISVIRTLIATYAPWVDLSLLPSLSAATLLGQVWRNKTLQWALQKIADIAGYDIWITPDKKLHYASPTVAVNAPFTLSDTPDNILSFPHAVDQFSIDDNAIINRVTFYGGQQPTPDFAQDVSTQANGNNTVFVLAYYARKSSSGSVTVTVNGAAQVLGYVFGTGTKNILKSKGGTCDVLLDAAAKTLTFDVAPAAGATVICTYRYQLPLIIQVAQQDSVSFFGGYYDGTISDETVVDTATAIRRCKVLLLEQAFGLTTLKLRCWRAGLQAGQQLQVTNTVRGINSRYIIQEVSATPLAPNTIEYTVTLGAWNWNLVDVLQQLSRATAGKDTADQETVNPTQINILATVTATATFGIAHNTRTGGSYFPGLTPGQTGYAAPGLFTI